MRFWISAAAFHRRRHRRRHLLARLRVCHLAQQRRAQLLHHRLRDIVLHRENILQRSVVGLRPKLIAVGHLHQLHGDPHPGAGLAHAAFEHRGDVQRTAHVGHGRILALEREGRRSSRHAEPANLREHVEELVGEPIREVLVFLVAAAVDERQHRDRRRARIEWL